MTIIDGIGPIRPAQPRRPGQPGPRFSPHGPASRAAAQSAAAAAEPIALDGLLAVQEAGAESVQDREARRHGHALLQALAALQHALLRNSAAETSAGESAAAIAELLARVPPVTDPGLGRALRGVILRARLELARRSA